MHAPEVVLIGIFMVAGLAWQGFVIAKDFEDDGPRRLYPPLAVGAVVLVGGIVWGVLRLCDDKAPYHFIDFMVTCGKSTLFFVVINAKSYLGPVFLATTAEVCVYHLFAYGAFTAFHS